MTSSIVGSVASVVAVSLSWSTVHSSPGRVAELLTVAALNSRPGFVMVVVVWFSATVIVWTGATTKVATPWGFAPWIAISSVKPAAKVSVKSASPVA